MSGTLLFSEILDKVHKAKTKTQKNLLTQRLNGLYQKVVFLLKGMKHQQEQNIPF